MRNPLFSLTLAMLACALGSARTLGQDQTQPAAPPPCSSTEARQFDFWIGEWDVHAGGQLRGKSSIQSILGGCTIYEQYDGVNGYSGKSLNVYDTTAGRWRQFWIDNQGLLLQLEGRYEGGRMILSGPGLMQGEEVLNRITWQHNPDDSVRQHWETSKDGGKSWQSAFDGRYTRRK